ncbi:GntR family transcriptional regulator [Yoonia sediminilitoris]|uniref:GntR family transcriptional regulator n=1 Tax=Yoonia sediminilitoris TaxID=1286148 RepID=A0A2T6KML5_9RHOB|nr:GntR family transcriptional regulator [Yoonia sediminilitoris]PUB17463.1 GntR family transcriptional regulator [Yoonia sediminilitoris]RCW97758.1 GntR family transcriptional regulator [Yoonia sediminilitoris]
MDTTSPPTAPDGDMTAVAQWVADVLRDRIIKGVLPAGARIVERKLSAELDVSRTPIREALKLLHADSLIEISRHKGAQVKAYSAEQALELFDVIASLESLAAERLAESITPEQLEAIESLHAEMLAFHGAGKSDDYFDVNSQIHDTILAYCGNPILQQVHTKLMARARRGRFMAIMDPDRLRTAVEEHEALMTALRNRDPKAACEVWRQHLLSTGRSVTDVLRSQGLG